MSILWTALWMIIGLHWIAQDRVVRDGDEEGHVGAAELFLEQLQSGSYGAALHDTWRGQLGEYPPAFPALVGTWWWLTGGDLPGQLAVRAICLFGLLLAAWATGRIARRCTPATGPPDRATWAEHLGRGAVLCLPLGTGLSRHFMPEGLLIGMGAAGVLCALWAGESPSGRRAAILGLVLGLGALVKQTLLPMILLPVILAARPLGRYAWTALATLALVAGPWTVRNLADQWHYASQSVSGGQGGNWLAHLLYYPSVLAWNGLGPVLASALVAGTIMLWRERHAGRTENRALWLGLAWFLGGLVLLLVLPKKYPRLLAPLLPGAVLCLALMGARWRRASMVIGTFSIAWVILAGTIDMGPPGLVDRLDPGCQQRWIRPAVADDLGLAAVASASHEADSGAVRVLGSPDIPCHLQTTHPWVHHLSPYLRRAGDDRPILEETDPGEAALVVDWTGGPGTPVDVPSLQRAFTLRKPVPAHPSRAPESVLP